MISSLEYLQNKLIEIKDIKIERFTSKFKNYYNDILQLEKELDESHGFIFQPSSLTEMYQNEYYIFLMDNICIGFIELRDNGDTCYISSYAIFKDYRGKGYGKLCLTKFLKHIKSRFKFVILTVRINNKPARNLYYSIGFKFLAVLLEGNLISSKINNVKYITRDKYEENKPIIDQLKNIYNKCYKYPETYMFFKNGIIVKLDGETVVAGCGINTSDFEDGTYVHLFYPASIFTNYLSMFIKDAISSSLFNNYDKYNINNSTDCRFYSTINRFGKPKSEKLIIKL